MSTFIPTGVDEQQLIEILEHTANNIRKYSPEPLPDPESDFETDLDDDGEGHA
jgi:hypothetical protein